MPANVESIKQVQANELGSSGGDASLLELLPLPAASIDAWPYASLAPLYPDLIDRDRYTSVYGPPRIQMPKAVVFYGHVYLESWLRLQGSRCSQHRSPNDRASWP